MHLVHHTPHSCKSHTAQPQTHKPDGDTLVHDDAHAVVRRNVHAQRWHGLGAAGAAAPQEEPPVLGRHAVRHAHCARPPQHLLAPLSHLTVKGRKTPCQHPSNLTHQAHSASPRAHCAEQMHNLEAALPC